MLRNSSTRYLSGSAADIGRETVPEDPDDVPGPFWLYNFSRNKRKILNIEKPDYLSINVKAVIKMLTNPKYFFFMNKNNFIINKSLKRISNLSFSTADGSMLSARSMYTR